MLHRLSLTLSFLALTALTAQECCDMSGPETIVLSAQHRFGRGVGYRHGYSSLNLFYASPTQARWGLPFIDLRGHVFNTGKWAANAGLGWRYLGPDACWVVGANVYYDYRRSHGNNYNQVSFGLEALGARWELRANGYVPVGRKHAIKRRISDFSFLEFSGNNIVIQQTKDLRVEQTMAGGDAEVGCHFWSGDWFDLYAGIGPYYFRGEQNHNNAFGGKARITAEISKYLTLEVSDTWDKVFHNRPQGLVALNLPFGPCATVTRTNPDCCDCPELLLERLYQPVEKQEIIVLSDYKKHFTFDELAIDPATGLPWFVIFVNNTSTDPLGTFENPYNTLLLAQTNSGPDNIIYVFPGDGTTTGMDVGILLQNEQFFWGSGTTQILPTTRGVISILPQTATAPNITNTLGDVVTLARNDQVVGFRILDPGVNGISGIDVGTLLVAHNDIFTPSSNAAINISSTVGSSNLTVKDNVLNNNKYGLLLTVSNSSTTTLDFEDNMDYCQNGVGLNFALNGTATIDATIKNNTLAGTTHDIEVIYNNDFPNFATLNATIDSNLITHAAVGVYVAPQGIDVGPAQLNFTVTNNQINFNKRGFEIHYANSSVITANFAGNSLSSNFGPGFSLFADFVDPTMPTNYVNDLTFTNNSILGNQGDGIFVQAENGPVGLGTGQFNMTVVDNNITGNILGSAIEIDYFGALSITGTINNNLMNLNKGDGLLLSTMAPNLDPTSIDLTITHNQINSNGGSGIEWGYANNSQFTALIDSNSMSNNFTNGFILTNDLDNTSSADYLMDFTFTHNELFNNSNAAIEFVLSEGSAGTGIANATVDSNSISAAPSLLTTELFSSGAIDFTLTYTNNTLTSGATFFMSSNAGNIATSTSTFDANVSNNTISNPHAVGPILGGINIESFNDSATASVNVNAACTNNIISNGNRDGIAIEVDSILSTGPTLFQALVTGNQMIDNAQVGFFADTDHTNGSLCLILGDNSSTNGYQLTNTLGTFTLENTGNNTGSPFTQGAGVVNGTCP